MVNFFFIFRVKTENTELPFIFSGIFTFLISFLIVFLSAVNLMASSPPITNDDWYYLGNEIDGINGYVNDIIFKDSCIYVAGSFCAAGSVRAQSIAKWDGHRWHSLEKRSDGFTEIYALCFDKNGHLIVGGIFDSIGGVVSYNIARWNGEIWQPLNNCCNRSTKRRVINALACDADGNIYAGGEFDTIGEVRALNIARWDGEKWDSLGPGFTNLSTNDCYVENIVFDSYGNVYVSGSFTNAGDVEINNIAKWDGVRWSSLGDGLPIHVNSIVCDSSGNVFAAGRKDSIFKWDGEKWNRFANIKGTVYSLKIDKQNKLYVCGEFTMNESINAKSIAIWDGSVWSSPYPIDASNYMRYLAVDNSGNICTGGYLFEKVHDTDASNIIKWDGTSWRALGQRVWAVTNSNKKHVINDVLVVNENEIYVGGLSNFGYPSSLFSRWDGENWKILEPPSIDGLTQAICRDRFGNIYIAGELEKSLDKKYGNIVKWDGSNWHTLGTGTNGKIFALAADNKGNLYAGGAFDSAGGRDCYMRSRMGWGQMEQVESWNV